MSRKPRVAPVSEDGMKIGYARVSTDMQHVDLQLRSLRADGCSKVFMDDGVSAVADFRPGLAEARKRLKPGDVFVVWAVDRAFRSTIDAILFLDGLKADGIAFRSLTAQIDPETPEGRKWYIGAANEAEYERAVISRRTKEGMAAAKLRGLHVGRPHLLSERQILRAHERLAAGSTVDAIAARLRVSPMTIKRGLIRFGLAP